MRREAAGIGGIWHHTGMPKRVKQKHPKDVNQIGHLLVQMTTETDEPKPKRIHKKKPLPPEVSAYMSALGKKGGKRSGKNRMTTYTPEKRSEIAMIAARARWSKRKATE